MGGRPFDRCSLYALLTNPLYIGKLRHKKNVYAGEHEPIVGEEVFAKVQAQLQRNGRSGAAGARNRYGALLRGLLYCKACDHAMVHNFTGRKGKRYRYYTCTHAIKCGRKTCPSGYLPAEDMERIVVDRIRGIAQDKQLGAEVVRQAQTLIDQELADLKTERRDLERELARHHAELGKLSVESLGSPSEAFRLADLHNLIARAETRLNEVRKEVKERGQQQLDPQDIAAAFGDFDATWNALSPRERVQALSLLVARVDYDATDTSIEVTFHPSTIKSLAARQREEAA
jgi:site-specific DNA recombinase